MLNVIVRANRFCDGSENKVTRLINLALRISFGALAVTLLLKTASAATSKLPQDVTVTEILGVWGAVLSTFLAGVKLWEIWRDRHRIEIGRVFTSDESIGNTISIRNLSSRAFLISYWELVYSTGWWPFRKLEAFRSQDFDVNDQKVEAYSTYKLTFSDQDYFGSSPKALKDRKIYIRICVAGRKPVLMLVYRSNT